MDTMTQRHRTLPWPRILFGKHNGQHLGVMSYNEVMEEGARDVVAQTHYFLEVTGRILIQMGVYPLEGQRDGI